MGISASATGGAMEAAPAATFRRAIASTILTGAGVPFSAGLEQDVVSFVQARIEGMPGHLRLGVEATETLLSLAVTAAGGGRSFAVRGGAERARLLRRWETSRLPPIRQYVHLVRSLVMFAAHELAAAHEQAER